VSRVNAADVAPEVAAASIVAPGTARRLLSDFADLNEGDVIIQNNAGSTVGQAVVQLAASKGVKTINIMRARNDWDDFVNHMHGLGATIVVTEDFARTSEFTKLVADLPAPKLGLNSVGGKSVRTVASTLGYDTRFDSVAIRGFLLFLYTASFCSCCCCCPARAPHLFPLVAWSRLMCPFLFQLWWRRTSR